MTRPGSEGAPLRVAIVGAGAVVVRVAVVVLDQEAAAHASSAAPASSTSRRSFRLKLSRPTLYQRPSPSPMPRMIMTWPGRAFRKPP